MKNIIKSLAVIVAVAAVAGTATWSYFTDKATVLGNTVAAGTLDFTLNGDMTETLSVNLPNMEPGGAWSAPKTMHVYNKNTSASTMDMKYMITSALANETDGGFFDKVLVKFVHGHCDSSYTGGVNPTNTYEGQLKNLNWISTSHSINGGKLEPNITHCFALYFKLDPSTGNMYQGDSATFNVVVDGTQFINPGWSE